jgi:hypothetical protein
MSQKFNGNDIFAPFNGGLYDIGAYDDDRAMQIDESKENILQEFKREYEDTIRDTLASAGVHYIGLAYYSPKFYNFATDSIDLECDIVDTVKLVEALKAKREAIQSALDANKSYDGYMAMTPDTFDEVIQEAERGHLNIMAVTVLLSGIPFADFDIYEYLIYEYACEVCEKIHGDYEYYSEEDQAIITACIAKNAQTITK